MRTRASYAAGLFLATVFVVAGCGGSSDDAGTSGGSGEAVSRDAGPAAPKEGDKAVPSAPAAGNGSKADQPSVARAIIKTGFVTLESADVGKARDQVTSLAAGYRGQVANEDSGTDDSGKMDRANLVLKVPTGSYDAAMKALQGKDLGTVKQVRQESSDVTEQVVDVNSRINTQRAGLARMRALMSRANTVGEVVSVETELTRREADLESLLARQKALAAQTDLATITVTVVKPGEAPVPKKDHSGFVGGLSAGWDAFSATATALATAAGALLPFGIAAAVVAVPAVAVYRRTRRTPAPAGQAPPD